MISLFPESGVQAWLSWLLYRAQSTVSGRAGFSHGGWTGIHSQAQSLVGRIHFLAAVALRAPALC